MLSSRLEFNWWRVYEKFSHAMDCGVCDPSFGHFRSSLSSGLHRRRTVPGLQHLLRLQALQARRRDVRLLQAQERGSSAENELKQPSSRAVYRNDPQGHAMQSESESRKRLLRAALEMNEKNKKAIIIGGLVLVCSGWYGYKQIAHPAPSKRKTSPYAPRPGLVDAAFRFEIGHKIYNPKGELFGEITKYQVKDKSGARCCEVKRPDGTTTLVAHSVLNRGHSWWIDGEMGY